MDTQKAKTIKDILGPRMCAVEMSIERIERISTSVRALGILFSKIIVEDGYIGKPHRFRDNAVIMDGLYNCVETLGWDGIMEACDLRESLGIEEE